MRATVVITETMAFCKDDLRRAEDGYKYMSEEEKQMPVGILLNDKINFLQGKISAYTDVLNLI
jgi:hypothetical protein